MNLRPYQSTAIARVLSSLPHRNPLLVMPTGGGKTITAAEIVRAYAQPTIWLAHREELILQAADALTQCGLTVGVIKAGHPARPAPVQVASVQTLVNRETPDAGLLVLDEAHRAPGNITSQIMEAYGCPRLGLTATPFRLDGRGLGDAFDDLIVACTTAQLVQAGYLHAPRVYAGRIPDLRGVGMSAGDYSPTQLAARYTDQADIVRTWQAKANGRRTVAFACTVEHSKRIVDAFREAGVTAEHVDGTTGRAERNGILARLRTGQTQIVSNVGILIEGYDLPSLECAIIARPTASLCIHLQSIGRIMRAADGKADAIVLDHAGNHHVHGLVTRELEYSLEPGSRIENARLDIKRCPACYLMVPIAARECECGHVFGSDAAAHDITGDADLEEFRDNWNFRREYWHILEAQRVAAGYQPGWSKHRYREVFDEWPLVVEGELIDPTRAKRGVKREVYAELLRTARRKGYKDGWASMRFCQRFGTWPRGFVDDVKSECDAAGIYEVGRSEMLTGLAERWGKR